MAEKILENLDIRWRFGNAPENWGQLQSSVLQEANLLGLPQPQETTDPTDGLLSLTHPRAGTVQVDLWPSAGLNHAYMTEATLQAACGLMSVHGRASGGPKPLGLPYLSVLTGAITLQAGLAGLLGQMNGGRFDKTQVSALACGLLSISQYLAGASASEDAECIATGSTDPELRPPFVSADGVVFEIETLDGTPWRRFWERLELDAETAGRAWTAFLLRYAKAISPIPRVCLELLSGLTFCCIREVANQTGVAVVPVRTVSERRSDHDYQRDVAMPWKIKSSNGIACLQHGIRPNELPLHGIRVIESCRRIQGPLAGHMLAMLGAEVIRLEPPGGDPLRAMPPVADGCSVRFDALNHLKQVREVDIKSAAGRKLIYEYVRESEVFLHNWAPGKAAELQLDASDMHAVKSDLVYAYAGGWGEGHIQAPGTDFTVQAWSGVAAQIAAASGIRGGSLFTVLDVLGGVIAALGTTAALLRRANTGMGCSVESSLLGSADLLTQIASMDRTGERLSTVLPTSDGLLAIECHTREQREKLNEILGVSSFGEQIPDGAISLNCDSTDSWLSRLRQQDIVCCPVVNHLADLARDPQLEEHLNRRSYASVNCPWRFV